jgi:hypothetical protein
VITSSSQNPTIEIEAGDTLLHGTIHIPVDVMRRQLAMDIVDRVKEWYKLFKN